MNALAETFRGAGELRRDEPMSRHTSWRVGGPAECWYRPADAEDLAAFVASLAPDTPIFWCGLGSNLLVRDGGIRGVVVSTVGALDFMEREGPLEVRAGAGVPCTRLARQCVRWGLGPAEFFGGIPGTLGGALSMNAGAYGGETWERVARVRVLSRVGEILEREPGEYRIGYRSVTPPAEEWFLEALLRFEPDAEVDMQKLKSLIARRRETQPVGLPSCGSVFRNPQGDHAARLIEAAGLKGHRIGGAEVSPKHANFIVNTGAASAADIEALIEHVRATVRAAHGVELQPEVRIVGEPA